MLLRWLTYCLSFALISCIQSTFTCAQGPNYYPLRAKIHLNLPFKWILEGCQPLWKVNACHALKQLCRVFTWFCCLMTALCIGVCHTWSMKYDFYFTQKDSWSFDWLDLSLFLVLYCNHVMEGNQSNVHVTEEGQLYFICF